MTRTKRYMIYTAVVVLMAASIAVAGFIGPIVVSVALEVMARRKRTVNG
jgi:hypothetical protein